MADGEIDFNALTRGVIDLPKRVRPGDVARLYGALSQLEDLPFPPGYVDALRKEAIDTLRGKVTRRVATHVYLAFFGLGDKAQFLKIGIAKDVGNRLCAYSTGNPLTNLWTYHAGFDARSTAGAVEAALLRHMSHDKARGEWVHIHGFSESAVAAMAESLAEIAREVSGEPVRFRLFGG